VYIVCEPNILFTAAEKTALIQFVQNGGGLFMVSDHTGSDRNSDGYDSPAIWNDFITNNSVTTNPFGITFDLQNFSGISSNIVASATDSIIHGAMGSVAEVQWANGTSMTLNPAKNATVKGVVYKLGTTGGGNTNALVAYARYGNGKVAAIGDSSPCDDGTGNTNATLYNGYTADAAGNHQKLLMNITIWLATAGVSSSVETVSNEEPGITIFPNPTHNETYISTNHELTDVSLTVFGIDGKEVFSKTIPKLSATEPFALALSKGFYFVKVANSSFQKTTKLFVY
jgi:hypothetical protein